MSRACQHPRERGPCAAGRRRHNVGQDLDLGLITFPLSMLVWIHQVSLPLTRSPSDGVASDLTVAVLRFYPRIFRPDGNLEALWENLQDAKTFEEWEAAGLALDHKYNIDYW